MDFLLYSLLWVCGGAILRHLYWLQSNDGAMRRVGWASEALSATVRELGVVRAHVSQLVWWVSVPVLAGEAA
jgi:hypothetical protein